MAARYALQQFVFHNTVTNSEELVEQGSLADSVTSQSFLQTPAAFWSTTPLTAGPQIHSWRAGWIAAYPNGKV